MKGALGVEDELHLRRLVARYVHHADAGETEAFAGLFTAEGTWQRVNSPPASLGGSGLPAEVKRGHAALKEMIEASVIARFNRRFRHQMTDLWLEACPEPDRAEGRARALITDWRDGPGRLAMCGDYTFVFQRELEGWKFAEVRVRVLPD